MCSKHSMFLMLLFISFTLNVFVSCKNPKEPDGFIFLNTLWTLESIEANGEIIRPPLDQIYTVQFFEDGTFKGRNDCNDFQGEYKMSSNAELEIIRIAGSEANCPNSIFKEYFEYFSKSDSYQVDGGNLRLLNGHYVIMLFTGGIQ